MWRLEAGREQGRGSGEDKKLVFSAFSPLFVAASSLVLEKVPSEGLYHKGRAAIRHYDNQTARPL